MISQELYNKLQGWRARLEINRNDLENECVQQPLLYDEIAQEFVKANAEYREVESQLKVTEARIGHEAKKNPTKFELDKAPSDTAMPLVIKNTAEYQTAMRVYLEAEEKAKALGALLEASNQRKSMLRDLVDLFVHQYYTAQQLGTPSSRVQSSRDADDAIAAARRNRILETGQEREQEIVKE